MASLRLLSYVVLDVFAERPLEGNQLAVFTDARGLSSEQMQALARETNLSETTFIIPENDELQPGQDRPIQVRIFTVGEELPFAGHPTLGTAYYLHSQTRAERVILGLKVGNIPVAFTSNGESVFGEMTQCDPEFGETYSREDIARLAHVSIDQMDPDLPIQTVSTGMPFAIVPLRSLKVVQALQVSWSEIAKFLEKRQAKFLYFVTRETLESQSTLHARMFFYNGEDPATGSAAGCCAGWAVANGVLAPEQKGIIEQGFEMHRPSRIHIRGSLDQGRVRNLRVGGTCVQVARGNFQLE